MKILTKFLLLSLLAFSILTSAQKTDYKFSFGASKGFKKLDLNTFYDINKGYGIDTTGNVINARNIDPNATKTFFFSVNVPEGNYKVTLKIGSKTEAGELTVKAESRRLMLEKVITKPGEFITKSFIVNVRKPAINSTTNVKLKERENSKLDWDDKLTLEFNGKNPLIQTIEIAKAEKQITVYLAGNSTVVDQEFEPWASWGQMIPCFFKPGVAIANHAESGLTLASFKSQLRLEKVLSVIKPGDYLFVEFGHNDQKMNGENDGAWKSYSDNLRYFIQQAKLKKAFPVVVTSTARRKFDENGKSVNTLGDFPAAARKVAQEENVPLIDLNQMTTELYDALGVEGSKNTLVHYPANTFPGQMRPLADNTHFNSYGAYELAKCIIEGIKKLQLPLSQYIVDMPTFDPKKPDSFEKFDLPLTPRTQLLKPDGN